MCTWEIAVIQQLTLVSVTNFLEGLPTAYTCIRDLHSGMASLPFTTPTQCLFCLRVVPIIAMPKVLVGYDRPTWAKLRTVPFKQSYFT